MSAPDQSAPDQPRPPWWRRRSRALALAVCAAVVATLLAVAALAPLPFSVTYPGMTADVLGESEGKPVISVSGAPVRDIEPGGELLMTTIQATSPDADVRLTDVISSYFASDEAVMPRDSVYPVGDTTEEISEYNTSQMRQSQRSAVTAALRYLGLDQDQVTVTLHLTNVGGPSAGLLFALGIVELLDGDGRGGDLTGGEVIAGTGTIEADGTVGAVGGVALKTQAAARDGATVFLVPREECADAAAELPDGLRLIPVSTLKGAVSALRSLQSGGRVPSC